MMPKNSHAVNCAMRDFQGVRLLRLRTMKE